jgi:hypothetical protein
MVTLHFIIARKLLDTGTTLLQGFRIASHYLRAQYDLLERGDEDCENPRVERGVDSRLSEAAR